MCVVVLHVFAVLLRCLVSFLAACCVQVNPIAVQKEATLEGVYWHCGKLGWVTRCGHGGAHISERAAAQAFAPLRRGVVKKKITKKPATIAQQSRGTPSKYWHVIYHRGKQA